MPRTPGTRLHQPTGPATHSHHAVPPGSSGFPVRPRCRARRPPITCPSCAVEDARISAKPSRTSFRFDPRPALGVGTKEMMISFLVLGLLLQSSGHGTPERHGLFLAPDAVSCAVDSEESIAVSGNQPRKNSGSRPRNHSRPVDRVRDHPIRLSPDNPTAAATPMPTQHALQKFTGSPSRPGMPSRNRHKSNTGGGNRTHTGVTPIDVNLSRGCRGVRSVPGVFVATSLCYE